MISFSGNQQNSHGNHDPKPRRNLLRLAGLLLALLLAVPAWTRTHPFLFYSSSDIAGLKAKTTDPFYADIFDHIKIDCQYVFGPTKSVSSGNTSRNYQRAMRSHAALMLLDPTLAADSHYQSNTLFFKYYNVILNYSGWGSLFNNDPLNTGYFLSGLAIGYDMNYSKFSSSQRSDIVSKLKSRCNAVMNCEYLQPPSNMTTSAYHLIWNKTIITAAALGIAAYALEGDVDETTRQKWIGKTEGTLAVWNQNAMADGVSLEGVSYNELMLELLNMYLEIRTRATGVNQFLRYSNIINYPYYGMFSWIPGGDRSFVAPIPFGDCPTAPAGNMRMNVSIMARRLKGTSYNSLAQLANWESYKPLGGAANNSFCLEDSCHYFYADSSVAMKSPSALGMQPWHYFSQSGVFVWRSGWDNMATYFALICGPQKGGHQHPESGNFVIYKGGAPYIAHHGYLDNHKTVDHNVPIFDGHGQIGESSNSVIDQGTPSTQWAQITQVLADTSFFDVTADLKKCYSTSKLNSATREYLGFADFYFVRDKTTCGSSMSHELDFHAFKTNQPASSEYIMLDLDSNPNANPWSGSAGSYTLKPRDSGPFTGSMTVKNLSPQTWTEKLSSDTISAGGSHRRGTKLVLSTSGSGATSLMAFAFPASGQTLAKWPGSNGDGFTLTQSGAVKALCVWPNSGAITASQGLTMTASMGGIHLGKGYVWGRNLKSLTYNGTTYVTATAPVSIFADTLFSTGKTIRVISSSSVTLSVRCLSPVTSVLLNGAKLTSGWSMSGNMLKVTLNAQPGGGLMTLDDGKKAAATPDWMGFGE